MKTQLKKTRTN